MEKNEVTESRGSAGFDVHDEMTGHLDPVTSREQQEPDNADQASSSSGGQALPSRPEDQMRPRGPDETEMLGAEITENPAARELLSEQEEGEGSDDETGRQVVKGPRLPAVNCPEKIIVCLDLSSEVNRVPFLQRDGTKHLPLELVKRALSMFIRTKSSINPIHEYALVVLQESAVWLQDFTSDVEEFLNVMFDLTNETQDCETFDLTSLFETIASKVELPQIEDKEVLPPPFIVRTLFFYGRSAHVPEFHSGREAHNSLSNSSYFFFDVFYLHEPPSEENCCKDVYDVFLDLDKNNTSYIQEVGRNTTHLYNKMATLVAHPLQRPEQVWASYTLDSEQ